MNPAILGALRALGVAVLIAILSFLGDATHLTFIKNPTVVTLISMIALAIEHQIESNTGRALFGAVKG